MFVDDGMGINPMAHKLGFYIHPYFLLIFFAQDEVCQLNIVGFCLSFIAPESPRTCVLDTCSYNRFLSPWGIYF